MRTGGAEYTGGIANWKSTVIVQHPRLGRVRMNTDAYDAATCGPIIEPPTMPPPTLSVIDALLKNPKVDNEGRLIADQHSPMLRA